MQKIDWKKDYKREFTCPECNHLGLRLGGTNKYGVRRFSCPNSVCGIWIQASCRLKTIKDKHELRINWQQDYRPGEFICPNEECNSRDLWLYGWKNKKQYLQCKKCKTVTTNSIDLTAENVSQYAFKALPIKPFVFEDDTWDVRSININCLKKLEQVKRYLLKFQTIDAFWLKLLIKKYIYSLCKQEQAFLTIEKHLSALKDFANYLHTSKVSSLKKCNRQTIINFTLNRSNLRTKLLVIKKFFLTCNMRGWSKIEIELIRDSDIPKQKIKEPDPISDFVREQIENKLFMLPEPMYRMWVIAFFCALRPYELAYLKKDCLVQEGEKWTVIWQRDKGNVNDFHELPITRTIAKVIQEQKQYIEKLWGEKWEYLFCHYHGISDTKSSHPKLTPVPKLIPRNHSPLLKAIRTLIKTENICDENGNIAKFSNRLVRPSRLTQLFEQGHDLAIVSAWAGHKRLATTSTYYTHVSCELIEKEAGYIQKALLNNEGNPLNYESFPKSFWKNPQAYKLELSGDHINTPIYGYCGLPLEEQCNKFRACYTCGNFVATPEKLPQYIKTRDELRSKQSLALTAGQDVLVEQFGTQADQLDKIIASLQEAA